MKCDQCTQVSDSYFLSKGWIVASHNGTELSIRLPGFSSVSRMESMTETMNTRHFCSQVCLVEFIKDQTVERDEADVKHPAD